MSTIKYGVNTTIEGLLIRQNTSIGGLITSITTRIVDTQDHQLREALIKLGWTPPNDKNK